MVDIQQYVSVGEIDGIFTHLIDLTSQINALKLERLENEQIIEKVWADAVTSGDIVPGKNDDVRAAQKRDRCPDESAELDRIDEELRAAENDLAIAKLQKERVDYLLRLFER